MLNSLKIALFSSAIAVGLGITAAYAFSRLKFRGREALMIGILAVLMLPAVATIIPLYVFLNQFRIEFGDLAFNLRASLVGVCLAVISAQLPFAIWNLKGYLDTIPHDLEEAAFVDGATQNQTFTKIVLPLATPAIAVTGFLGFLGGWTEYLTAYMFIGGEVRDWTLSIALNSMVGQFARNTPWSRVRRVRDPVRDPGVGRVLHLPALPRRRPRGRRREGLIDAGCRPARQEPNRQATPEGFPRGRVLSAGVPSGVGRRPGLARPRASRRTTGAAPAAPRRRRCRSRRTAAPAASRR